jgi:opacity protein-like surface antigen
MKLSKRVGLVAVAVMAFTALAATPAFAIQRPPDSGGGSAPGSPGTGGRDTAIGTSSTCTAVISIRFDSGYVYPYYKALNCNAYDVQFEIHLQNDATGKETDTTYECATIGASCDQAWRSGARLANPSGSQEWEAGVEVYSTAIYDVAGAYTWG